MQRWIYHPTAGDSDHILRLLETLNDQLYIFVIKARLNCASLIQRTSMSLDVTSDILVNSELFNAT